MNHAYEINDDELILDFQFPMPEATREAFIIPNVGTGVSILESSSWLDEIQFNAGTLYFSTGAPGKQVITWPKVLGRPIWTEAENIKITISESIREYTIQVETDIAMQSVEIKSTKK